MSAFLCLVCVLWTAYAQPQGDNITSLPGLTWNIEYEQYSGYLDLSNGHHLHYWFTESMSNPKTDPLVLWLNGGPGCSSLDGMMYEQGPIHVYDNGTIYPNPYAWNTVANVIFLESPICVGFSYSDSGSCSMTDNTTADDNYNALIQFFNKFPDLKENDFYVTGESYGGVYVPTLVNRILHGNNANANELINLKGFAVGNGLSSYSLNDDSAIWLAYHHGLIGETTWNTLLTTCCTSPYTRQLCPFSTSKNAQCQSAVNKTMNVIYGGQLNWYNIYGDCFTMDEYDDDAGKQMQQKFSYEKMIHELSYIHRSFHESNDYRFIKEMIADYKDNVPCLDTKGADMYLNRNDVKTALHISPKVTQDWSICSGTLKYESQYSDLSNVYESIFAMDSDIYAYVYNGDTDLSCNFMGDEWFVDDLNYTQIGEYHEWYITDENGVQVAGWTKNFVDENINKNDIKIAFVTVRGSGHMVPQYKPPEALKMFKAFLNRQSL